MVKSVCPPSFDGKNLAELKIRSNYKVTVVAVNHGNGVYDPAFPETVLKAGDHLVVAGGKKALDEFVQLQ
jgi:trk system potassium uptake protein TrkA